MESAHSLILNEAVVQSLPEAKRDIFIFEWLRFLDRVLGALTRVSKPLRSSTPFNARWKLDSSVMEFLKTGKFFEEPWRILRRTPGEWHAVSVTPELD